MLCYDNKALNIRTINAEFSPQDRDNRLQDAIALSSLIIALGAQEASNVVSRLHTVHFASRPRGDFWASILPLSVARLGQAYERLVGSPEEKQLLHLGSVMGVRYDEVEGFVASDMADEARAEVLIRLSKCTDPGYRSFIGKNPGFVDNPPTIAELADLIPEGFANDPRLSALYVALGVGVRHSISPLN